LNVEVHVALRPALVVCHHAGGGQASVLWPFTGHHTEPRFAGKLKADFAGIREFFARRNVALDQPHEADGEDGDDLVAALRGGDFGGGEGFDPDRASVLGRGTKCSDTST
jgi:hypothetical protein